MFILWAFYILCLSTTKFGFKVNVPTTNGDSEHAAIENEQVFRRYEPYKMSIGNFKNNVRTTFVLHGSNPLCLSCKQACSGFKQSNFSQLLLSGRNDGYVFEPEYTDQKTLQRKPQQANGQQNVQTFIHAVLLNQFLKLYTSHLLVQRIIQWNKKDQG